MRCPETDHEERPQPIHIFQSELPSEVHVKLIQRHISQRRREGVNPCVELQLRLCPRPTKLNQRKVIKTNSSRHAKADGILQGCRDLRRTFWLNFESSSEPAPDER